MTQSATIDKLDGERAEFDTFKDNRVGRPRG